MQPNGESNLISSSSATATATDAPPPSPFPPSIGIGKGMGMGIGNGAPMRSEKDNGRSKSRKKLPTPREMIAHYESKGMQPQEASLKVIDDLQNLLVRVVTKNTRNTNPEPINTRLLRLESKLDSKPGYPQSLGIGILSGAVIHVFPQVVASVANIWNSVRASTSST